MLKKMQNLLFWQDEPSDPDSISPEISPQNYFGVKHSVYSRPTPEELVKQKQNLTEPVINYVPLAHSTYQVVQSEETPSFSNSPGLSYALHHSQDLVVCDPLTLKERPLTLQVGQKCKVILQENITTGYTWQLLDREL